MAERRLDWISQMEGDARFGAVEEFARVRACRRADVTGVRDDVAMAGFTGVTVEAPEGPRWELALALLASGDAAVRVGDVEMSRDARGPNADGMICMAISVSDPEDRDSARAALLRGRQAAYETRVADPRFARLLDEYGCRWEIVADYGMGTALLARADRDGELVWGA